MVIRRRRPVYNPADTLERIGARTDQVGSFEALDEMVERHGVVHGRPYSFKDHECLRQIIRDTARRIYSQKSSQVGLTEALAQKVLAICATLHHENVILTQPDLAMARRFAAGRINPILENSKQYSSMLSKAVNSTTQKQIGSSFLYIGGAGTDGGAISVPALVVVSDESDFSNQVILGKLSSRLSHNEINEHGEQGYRFEFSTPTTEGWGINAKFNSGCQFYYMVRCKHCGEWVCVNFFEDFDIPGMDKPLKDLLIADASNPKYRFKETVIRCSSCRGDLYDSLRDPDRRQWVAKFPDRHVHSYQISPWDVPKYNTPAAIMNRLSGYEREEDFFNFALGLPMSTMDNSFNVSLEHRQRLGINPSCGMSENLPEGTLVMGMDVGKTCHLSVAVSNPNGHLEVIWQEQVHNRDGKLADQIKERFDYYQPAKFLLDAHPETEMASELVAYGKGRVHAVEYATSRLEGLKLFITKDKDPVDEFFRYVRVDRTKILSRLMKDHNMGHITYPAKTAKEVFDHLSVIRKVRNPNAERVDDVERIESSNDKDHWGHSLGYTLLAALMIGEEERSMVSPPHSMPPTISKLRIGGGPAPRDLYGKMY